MQALKDMIDAISSPQLLTAVVVIVFVLALRFRQLTLSPVSYLFLLLPVIALVVGVTDKNFSKVITKADNVPIVIMVGLVIFLTWYAMRLAVRNDQTLGVAKSLPEDVAGREKVLDRLSVSLLVRQEDAELQKTPCELWIERHGASQ